MVNEKSGEVYFVAPKMKISESSKFCRFVLMYDGMACCYCPTLLWAKTLTYRFIL